MSDLLICIDRKDFPAEIPHPFFLPESSPVVCLGSTELLESSRFTILNSRQSPRLNNQCDWIQKTLKALHSCDPNSTALVTSLGTTSWDFLSWAGARLGFPIILVFPGGSAQNFKISRTRAIMDLGLDDRTTLALRPLLLKKHRHKAETNALRDTWIMALSQRYVPISVRPKGNMDSYLSQSDLDADDVFHDFRIGHEKTKPVRKPLAPRQVHLPDWYESEDYLIHWTRSCIGPWPDETKAEHFERSISKDVNEGGLATLLKILKDGCIRCSGRLIRGKYEVVPFTQKPPGELHELIRWRSGLRRWTFEPYGIALKKSKLIELGAKPVIYGDLNDFESLSEEDKPFFQLAGSGKQDWRREKEWRIRGNVDLDLFKENEAIYIVNNEKEGPSLPKYYQHRVIALC